MTGRRLSVVVVILVAVALWWWWPGLSGRGGDVHVVMVAGSRLESTREPLDRRLREDGFRTAWSPSASSWCDVPALVEGTPPTRRVVVVAPDPSSDCILDDALVEAVDRAVGADRLVIVAWPDDDSPTMAFDASLARRGARLVETVRLLGEPGSARDCLWWDDCPAAGNIVAWDSAGLREAGAQRVARMIVAAVR